MKKLLAATSAAALTLGLGLAPALANPTVKNADDVWNYIYIYTDDIYNNRDVAIEAYNVSVLSENDMVGYVYDVWFHDDVYTGFIDADGDFQYRAAGQFSQVLNTGVANVNQAGASIAANADITFESN